MLTDIGNAYLNAPCREKIWTVTGPEFGSKKGIIFLITRELYDFKSAGASWRTFFAHTLINELKFKPTHGDPDVCIFPQTNVTDS
eukprot:751800-Ditylum_brightwellii.AAC.1